MLPTPTSAGEEFWAVADHPDAALAACAVPVREREQVTSPVAGLEADVLGT